MNEQDQAVLSVATERRDFGSLRLRGRIWWLRYRVDGKEHWESSRSTSRRVAERLLARRQAEYDAGLFTAPDVRRVSFADLERMLTDHYKVKGLKSARRVRSALAHLRSEFGAMRATAITSDRITTYEVKRLEDGASRASVNYELAMLRKAFSLAVRAGRLPNRPPISTPAAKNARTGFFERADFDAVLKQLPPYLQPVMHFAYLTGWRVPSEVLTLTWARVDFDAGLVRLYGAMTKNGEGRDFPFDALPELKTLLESQRAYTDQVEREREAIIPLVFHRNGKAIRNYYGAWRKALRLAATDGKAGPLIKVVRPHLLGRIPHDFRRTAVRNLVRAGVDEYLAMKLTGHKTRAIFDRYNITDEADLRAGVEKLAKYSAPVAKRAKGTTRGQSRVRVIGERHS